MVLNAWRKSAPCTVVVQTIERVDEGLNAEIKLQTFLTRCTPSFMNRNFRVMSTAFLMSRSQTPNATFQIPGKIEMKMSQMNCHHKRLIRCEKLHLCISKVILHAHTT